MFMQKSSRVKTQTSSCSVTRGQFGENAAQCTVWRCDTRTVHVHGACGATDGHMCEGDNHNVVRHRVACTCMVLATQAAHARTHAAHLHAVRRVMVGCLVAISDARLYTRHQLVLLR